MELDGGASFHTCWAANEFLDLDFGILYFYILYIPHLHFNICTVSIIILFNKAFLFMCPRWRNPKIQEGSNHIVNIRYSFFFVLL